MHKMRILDGFISEPELARQLGRCTAMVARWRKSRVGPVVTMLGRLPYYSEKHIHDWLHVGGVSGVEIRAASRRTRFEARK